MFLVKLDRLGKTLMPANWFIFEKDTTEEVGALDPHCGRLGKLIVRAFNVCKLR